MNETYRKMSIVFELDRAIKYLRLGLAEIQKISPANDFYDPVFIYLSGGLERLFKSMLCLNFLEMHGRLPNPNEIWKNNNGHDIVYLKSKIEQICIPVTRPFAAMDYDIIVKDKFIDNVCEILSEFGKRSRYFNLDAILGVEQKFDSGKVWEKLENEVSIEFYGEEQFYKILTDSPQIDEIYAASNREIVIRLEKFFRALARQFIFGNFSKESNKFLFQVADFTDIRDNQLGNTDYGQFKNYEFIKRRG